MSETNVAADVNATPEESSEVDSQLAEMQTAEGAVSTEGAGGQDTVEGGESHAAPEVKKVVPLAALHEERKARQELQRQMAEINRRQAERDAIIERRLAALANPQQQPAVPDRNEQPVEYLDHRLNNIAAQQQAILERDAQRANNEAQQQAIQRAASAVIQAREAFKKEAPDFPEAITHLNTARTRQLIALGMPEDQAAIRAERELDQAAIQWTAEGRNPAQIAYEFAKANGYQPKPAQAAPADKIAAQQKGTAAARSLGGGGAVSSGKLTAEALANMSDEDFSKLTDAQFKQAMGG